MVLPNGAENVDNAAVWMDYIYHPENAARITEYVGYNSPVSGVREVFEAGTDYQKALAESPLIFPDEATLAGLHLFGAEVLLGGVAAGLPGRPIQTQQPLSSANPNRFGRRRQRGWRDQDHRGIFAR